MQKYQTIFFDWDGTAVRSRKADASIVIKAMETLLLSGVKLVIVSGTTYNNICEGKLEQLLSKKALQNLYLGLARGNYNYGFDKNGRLKVLCDNSSDVLKNVLLHEAVFALHRELLTRYSFETDIVFSRPGYCKMDIMVNNARDENSLFMQSDEVAKATALLQKHGIQGGPCKLTQLAIDIGTGYGLDLKVTTDAKYLEIGYTTKSDNIDFFVDELHLDVSTCCFWGDEFGAISEGIWGSDAQMITDKTKDCHFYSVSEIDLPMPNGVITLGGKEDRFVEFLQNQMED